MNHVNFDIEKETYKIIVHVEVVEQKTYPLVPIVNVTTEDIKHHLRISAIVDVDRDQRWILIKEDSAHNKRNNTRNGTWIFRKALDKSPKQVILKEEKRVQPKPIRKKHTRSSTKKVSTEE